MNSNAVGQQVGSSTITVGLSSVVKIGGVSGQIGLKVTSAVGGQTSWINGGSLAVGTGCLWDKANLDYAFFAGPLFISCAGTTLVVSVHHIATVPPGITTISPS